MSVSLDIEIKTDDSESRLPEFQRLLMSLPEVFLKYATEIVEDEMRQSVPVSSGRLQSSISSSVEGLEGTVQTNTGYGAAVDKGRRGLDIYPRNGKFLRFFYNGKIVYAKHAHPGPSKPNNFIKRTILQSGDRISPMLDDKIREVLSRA